jgi:hypothetical protein
LLHRVKNKMDDTLIFAFNESAELQLLSLCDHSGAQNSFIGAYLINMATNESVKIRVRTFAIVRDAGSLSN